MSKKIPNSVFLAVLSGWKFVSCETDLWIRQWNLTRGAARDVDLIWNGHTSGSRIHMARNSMVHDAQQEGASHILFIDPDMIPDAYVGRDPHAKPVWESLWEFSKENPGAVVAAPYCGQHPDEHVQVFARDSSRHLRRVSREQAAMARGWHRVAAVGTGFMLIDMDVFDRLSPPYFHDTFTDESQTQLKASQDIAFCKKCVDAGVPIYVDFDCWCDHQQFVRLTRPGWTDPTPPPAPELVVP